MWLIYAAFSALFAALVSILAKLGLKNIDPTLATTVRGVIMASFLLLVSLSLSKFENFSLASFSSREWVLIILSGIAGAISWLFFFTALKGGPAGGVNAIDRMSIVFVIVFAALFLGEGFNFKIAIGAGLMALGAALIVFQP